MTYIYIYTQSYMRDNERQAKGQMKNSSCLRSFVLKVAPNHGQRYSELPKAIPCNILKYNLFMYVLLQSLECNMIFQFIIHLIIGCCLIPMCFSFSSLGLRHAKSDTQAIPLLKRYSHGSTQSPKGFPQVLHVP